VVVPAGPEQVLGHARDGAAAVTLVNVWATWCGPCREEFPAMLAAIERHKDDARLVLYSADFDDQTSAVRAFLAERGVRDTVYLKTGDDTHFINTLHPDWSGALPATLVFDRAGELRAFWEGEADSARFEQAIVAALQPHGGTP
jgi:thiol-disulfide isomerase/thioredoxin